MSNWNKKKEEEIIQRLKINLKAGSIQLIGEFTSVEEKDFGFFKDVRLVLSGRKFYYFNLRQRFADKKAKGLALITIKLKEFLNQSKYLYFLLKNCQKAIFN